jgi:hypothetical protein
MEGLISFSIFIMGAYHSYLQKCTPLDKNVITKACNNTSLVIVFINNMVRASAIIFIMFC